MQRHECDWLVSPRVPSCCHFPCSPCAWCIPCRSPCTSCSPRSSPASSSPHSPARLRMCPASMPPRQRKLASLPCCSPCSTLCPQLVACSPPPCLFVRSPHLNAVNVTQTRDVTNTIGSSTCVPCYSPCSPCAPSSSFAPPTPLPVCVFAPPLCPQ